VGVSFVGHARVQDGDGVAIAGDDQRAGVAVVTEVARGLAVVEDGDFLGLDTKVVAGVGFELRVAAERQVRPAPVLGDDVQRLAVLVYGVGSDDEVMRQDAGDGELEVLGDSLVTTDGNVGPEEVLELP